MDLLVYNVYIVNKMQSLPLVNLQGNYKEKSLFNLNDLKDYEELQKLIVSYVDGDCWALVLNDEILFNSYEQEKSIKETLTDKMLRDMIVKDPHRLCVQMHRLDHCSELVIYMYGEAPFTINIHFCNTARVYMVSSKRSQQHVDEYVFA